MINTDYQSYTVLFRGAIHSAYLLLVAAIYRVSPICRSCRSIHAWIMRRWQSISITIINLSSIVCPIPWATKICSKLPNPNNNSSMDKLEMYQKQKEKRKGSLKHKMNSY
jgi:ABC-type multidrug transport system permease subunit